MTTERTTDAVPLSCCWAFTFTRNSHTDECSVGRLEREVATLREQLRLTNDKMDAQVRQARWEVAREALDYPNEKVRWGYLQRALNANAPKD